MEIKYAGLNTLAAFYEKCKEKFALLTHIHSWNDLNDKPFGEMIGDTVVILPETSFESAGGEELTYIDSSQTPIAEQEYTVVFDDVEYNITTVAGNNVDNASLDDGCVVFGNATLMFGVIQDFGDYPFFIVYNSSDSGFNIYTEDSGTYKVEIYKNDTTVKQLDEKYLPDHTHETSEVNRLDELLENKSDSGHAHDDRYYTESEIDIKLSDKANSSHGNHVPATETANDAKFLRNDNTWQTVTPANIGAAELNYVEGIYDNAIASYDEAAVANSSTELVNGIAMYEFINKIKNMTCTTYDLTCSVAVDSNYTITVNSAKLIGNNLSFELTIERSSNCTAGDISNETVGTIIVTHDGKITGFRRVSIPPANYGGLASFFMANLTTEDTTLQFDIGLAAAGTACKKWSLHFALPVRLDMDAY